VPGSAGNVIGGRYRLTEKVGEGGMGRVWRARDELLDRVVAVKEVLLPWQAAAEEHALLVARAMREARAAARLNHPGVITIHDVIEHDGTPWIVMEFITGRSLAAEINAATRLSWQRTAEIGEQIASALAVAHENRIVHRDLKPDNVLLQGQRVIVTDFGIARIMDATTQLTMQGSIVGTPQYMAPEQLREGSSSTAVDMWALGCTLYCAVEGKPPYDAPSVAAVIAAVVERRHRPPAHAGQLGDLLERLLARDPAQRPDARAAARELASLRSAGSAAGGAAAVGPAGAVSPSAGGSGTAAPPTQPVSGLAQPGPGAAQLGPTQSVLGQPGSGQPAPGPGRPVGQPQKRRLLLAGVAAATALVVVLGVVFYLATDRTPSGKNGASGGGPSSAHTSAAAKASPACATGSIKLYGSSAFQEIAQGAATAYMNTCPHSAIAINPDITGADSAFGVGKVQEAVKSGSASAGSTIAMYDGSTSSAKGLEIHPIGVLIYSVIAHTDLFRGSKITQGQLVNIFVEHSDPGLVAVGRLDGSGSRLTFFNKVLHANPGPPDPHTCPTATGHPSSLKSCTADGTSAVIKFVNGTPNAIGYAEVLGSLQGDPHVSKLWIDNVQPTKLNVLNGSYKYWTIENLYTGARLTPLAKDFIDYLPSYIESAQPGDFITCSDAAGLVGPDCRG
jgi:tRNA A-37 threonylcarbamoyl transferase component Bud32/ABC-type phosphate transport system substrate-binding protein